MCVGLGGILSGGDGIPITDDAHAYDVYDIRSKDYDSYFLAFDAMADARADSERREGEGGGRTQLQQEEASGIIYWIYEAETEGGMFTREAVADMHEAEGIMLRDKQWDEFCQLQYFNRTGARIPDDDVKCRKPMSAVTMFYPDSWDSAMAKSVIARLEDPATRKLFTDVCLCIDAFPPVEVSCNTFATYSPEDQSDMMELRNDIESITSKWSGEGELVQDPAEVALFAAYMKLVPTRAYLSDFYFDKEFSVENPVSMYSRTVLFFGGPHEGYKNVDDKEADQEKEVKDYVMDNLYDDIQKVSKRSHSKETNTFYFMTLLIFEVFLQIILMDTMAAIGSVILVFLYVWYMIGSLFLALVGMAEILLSIPCAWFLFRGIFQIEYFSGLNMLTIFIVCAIGADDIFVFMDAYNQSKHKGPEVNQDLQTRMTWVWRKSGKAMAITSATTCMAFLCTCFSPIAGTRSFGIFAALVILWDYVLVMSLFCTAVVIYHNHFEREPMCTIPILKCGCCTKDCGCMKEEVSPTGQIMQSFHDGDEIPMSPVTKFFYTKFADFILSVKGRVIVLVLFLAWIIPAIIWVTKLEPTKTAEQFLSEDHPLQYGWNIIEREFPSSTEDRGLPVFFSWGIAELDQSGVNQLIDANNVGKPRFKKFEMNPTCQEKIMKVCEDLEIPTPERLEILKRSGEGKVEVRCVMREFHKRAQQMPDVVTGTGDYPTVATADVTKVVKDLYDNPPERMDGVELVADMLVKFGFDGEEVKFVTVEVESNEMNQWSSLPEDDVRPIYGQFMDLATHLDGIVGDACGESGVLMTDEFQKFIFMNNQKIYRTSAVQGACIGVALAFAVLALATWSPILSVLSTLSILCTIMSVIGTVTMLGWSLGTVEAILISILAGFSVDYVVHLAHAYATSFGTTEERIREAFREMGTPVLSGMLTSVLASLPLFTCEIVFFAKFGTFLCFTILWSWIFANFGFMSLLATVGPAKLKEGQEGQRNEEQKGQEMGAVSAAPPESVQN
eukprot:CAMPEP_0181291522 /NCGR_PEP_ID=MMETSP1101-20121128/2012_1 /TAXON_ID=46948 /ORGANISM="Rhodomonas abbreviata, Strain Caron Lab Isolate" /LENGTH=1010 /DNA_ID=CAMNT_0023395919 /DNA_START=391 /DNA_END=3423 /DNA_ORIENTATION=-